MQNRKIGVTVLLLPLFAGEAVGQRSAQTGRDEMTIVRQGSRAIQRGPETQFTGIVRVEPLFAATDTTRTNGAAVTFEPGARSAWHSHPRGQTLIVTAGIGRVQRRGGAVEEIRVGDVVWTPPGVEHWHGASPTSAMSHIAIQESLNGQNVVWGAKVTDAEYGRAARAVWSARGDTSRSGPYADVAPALDDITQQVLFGNVWERPGLSKRDRSLITVATLIAGYRANELPYHLNFAQQNGVSRAEIRELITHLAFYAGWPAANTAVEIARKAFADSTK